MIVINVNVYAMATICMICKKIWYAMLSKPEILDALIMLPKGLKTENSVLIVIRTTINLEFILKKKFRMFT